MIPDSPSNENADNNEASSKKRDDPFAKLNAPALPSNEVDELDTSPHPLLEQFEDDMAAAIADPESALDNDSAEEIKSEEDNELDDELEVNIHPLLSEFEDDVSAAIAEGQVNLIDEEEAEDQAVASIEIAPSADIDEEVATAIPDDVSPDPIALPIEDDLSSQDQYYHYKISVQVPPHIKTLVQSALTAIGLADVSPQDIFQWQAPFQAENLPAIISLLETWVNENLPLKTSTKRVYSEVVGAQRYIAGWELDNTRNIYQAHLSMTSQLADLIIPHADADATFRAILPILPEVPVEHFAHLVGYLQQHFEPQTINIEAIEILQRPADDRSGNWEVIKVIDLNESNIK